MANEVLASYSPEDVTIVIAQGNLSHVVNGYVDGTFLTISRLVLASEPYSGSDVSNARVVRSNKNSTLTLSLMMTSESNDILGQLLRNDEQTRDNTNLFSMTIKDNTGRSIYFSRQCYIGNNPDSTYSNAIDSRDWSIHAVKLEQVQGGNAEFSPATAADYQSLGGTIDPRWLPQQ
jgi:hypothetical protein